MLHQTTDAERARHPDRQWLLLLLLLLELAQKLPACVILQWLRHAPDEPEHLHRLLTHCAAVVLKGPKTLPVANTWRHFPESDLAATAPAPGLLLWPLGSRGCSCLLWVPRADLSCLQADWWLPVLL